MHLGGFLGILDVSKQHPQQEQSQQGLQRAPCRCFSPSSYGNQVLSHKSRLAVFEYHIPPGPPCLDGFWKWKHVSTVSLCSLLLHVGVDSSPCYPPLKLRLRSEYRLRSFKSNGYVRTLQKFRKNEIKTILFGCKKI